MAHQSIHDELATKVMAAFLITVDGQSCFPLFFVPTAGANGDEHKSMIQKALTVLIPMNVQVEMIFTDGIVGVVKFSENLGMLVLPIIPITT